MPRRLTYKPWTPAEVARLAELRAAGLEFREIAATLDRTAASVRSALCRWAVEKCEYRRTAELAAEVCKPHRTGEVARRLGIKPRSVRSARHRLKAVGFPVYSPKREGKPC